MTRLAQKNLFVIGSAHHKDCERSYSSSTFSSTASINSSSEQWRSSHSNQVCRGESVGSEIPNSQLETVPIVTRNSFAISLCFKFAFLRKLLSFSRGAIKLNYYKSIHNLTFKLYKSKLDFFQSIVNNLVEERLVLPTTSAPPTIYPEISFGIHLPDVPLLTEIFL